MARKVKRAHLERLQNLHHPVQTRDGGYFPLVRGFGIAAPGHPAGGLRETTRCQRLSYGGRLGFSPVRPVQYSLRNPGALPASTLLAGFICGPG